jgi:acyl CoA:acetate/3-ketoacid CoA transferase beta subunit
MIITELAVFEVEDNGGLVLTEVSPESSVEEIRERTEADFTVSDNLTTME